MPEEGKKQNWFMKHKVVTGILVIIVLFFIIGSGGSKKGSSTTTGSQAQQAKTEEKTVAKLNEPVVSGDLSFIATSVSDSKILGNSFTKKEAQGTFKIITLKISNTGKETKTVDSSMIKLKDDQGRTYERSIEGQTAKGLSQGKVDLFLQQVQPGLSVTGDIVFDVPADANNLILSVQGGFFTTAAEIKLD